MEKNGKSDSRYPTGRKLMKSGFGEDQPESDQQKRLPQPPLSKAASGGERIPLTKDFSGLLQETDYLKLVESRQSIRKYRGDALTLPVLAFLLWSTQGIKSVVGRNHYATLRPVPSAGARHPLETYIAALHVEGLPEGIYHYLPLEHELELIRPASGLGEDVARSLCEQDFAGKSAAVFFYSAVAYRCEWRYTTESHKLILLDAGHVMQNLYLSCGAVGCGTCAIAAYDQTEVDKLLGLDGEDEFVIYAAPVGLV